MPTTVDKIRRALEKRDGIAEEEMRPLADAYRTEVQSVNQRLDESVMLLRKGLRSEAIQRVEMTPNALDKATELEFPEWDEWNEILQFMAIPLPPKLNQDYVAQINEAIIESLPLDALLRRHRRLAIAKAPLGVRLRTLRQISRVDATNDVWNEDVEGWEKIRLQQIDGEMKSALEKEDSRQLFTLHRELTSSPWRITPSPRLIEQSSFAAQAHVRESQEATLSQIAPKLQEAFENRNEARARALRTEWQAARAKFNLDVPAKYETIAGTALQWLEDLDRQAVMESERQMAVADLETKIDSNKSFEEVQAAYQQAKRFGEPVPEELDAKVKKLAEAPAKQRKVKMIVAGVGVGAVLVALVAGGLAMMSSASSESKRQEIVGSMQRLVASEEYEQAVQFANSIKISNPEIASGAEMVQLQVQAQSAMDKQKERDARFATMLNNADNEDPALIDETLLPQLAEIAQSDAERQKVDELMKRKEAYMAGEANRQSDEMVAKVSEFRTEFGRLRSREAGEARRDAVRALLSQIIRMPNQYPLASDEANAQQQTLRDQVRSILKQMESESMITEMRDDAIEQLMASRTLIAFADHLREYSTQTVSRTGFVDFKTVLEEEDHWMKVDRINAWLRDDFAEKLKDGVSSSEAVNLITSAESLQGDISPNPVFAAMPDYFDTMKEIRSRKTVLEDGFARIKRHPLARAVSIPEPSETSPTGVLNHLVYSSYYQANKSKLSKAGSIGVQVIGDSLGRERNRSFSGPVPTPTEEPLASFQGIVNEKNRSAQKYESNWETTLIKQIVDVRNLKDLDGLFKEWLINDLMQTASQGSERFKGMTLQTRQFLARRESARSKWYEPRSGETSLDSKLDQMLMAELRIAYTRFAKPLQSFDQVAAKRLVWIGFLTKSSHGEIEYHVRGKMPEGEGKLYVSIPSRDGDSETSIVGVGELKSGHITLDPNSVHQIPGRPLFLFPN